MARSTQRRSIKPKSPQREAIEPLKVYSRREAMALLRLGEDRLREEVYSHRLTYRQECRRQLFLGQWLLDWIKGIRSQ